MTQVGDEGKVFKSPTFTGIDSSYSLPENVALITLEVINGWKCEILLN